MAEEEQAVIAAGVAAGGAAVAGLSKMAVDAYANYEQLAGGMEKLYQNASDTIMKYANEAYKTSGMSANQYMEQASSFSASLVNSLGGNYEAAAKQTDKAMRAISDNFNTFGGDMSMIQGAFQGFAKQNYTMLDNLKLGYGGTKTEMERLIEDANEYAKANGMAADLSIDSFSDIVTAIDLIQQKQHIAGTTAKEAATTIEGSVGMAKAAWENLLVGFADSEQDIGKLSTNFADALATAAGNVVPRFIEAFSGIVKGVPAIAEALKNAFIEQAGSFAGAGLSMVESIAKGLSNNIPAMVQKALPMIANLSEALRANAPKFLDVGIDIITNMLKGIMNALPIIIQYVPVIVGNLAATLIENAPKILETGVQLITILVKGIISALPAVKSAVPKIIKTILAAFKSASWGNVGKAVVKGIAAGIKGVAGLVKSAAKAVAKAGINAIKSGFASAKSVGAAMIKALGAAIKGGASMAISAARNMANSVVNGIKSAFAGVASIGMNLVRGIWSGISGGLGWIKGMIRGWVGNVKSFLKSLFGIHSPSAWARDVIGYNIVRGMADGIEDNEGLVESAMEALVSVPDFGMGSVDASGVLGDMKQVSMTNYITVDGAENPEEFASRFARQLKMDMRTA